MTRRLLVLRVAPAALLALVGALAVVLASSRSDPPPAGAGLGRLETCRGLVGEGAHDCYARELGAIVHGREKPGPAVARITRWARGERRYLASNCHGVMHAVGRAYAAEANVTPARLMDVLPASNDPGCAAGFAHGVVTAMATEIASYPTRAARVCARATTRYRRYSCVHGFGHAFMRMHDDQLEPALRLCIALGPRAAADCAQGAYHDYWFAVAGADDASIAGEVVRSPRTLCAAQPEQFVRACWYRAFLENRPEAFSVAGAADLDELCEGLDGLQRAGCITGAAVIGPSDPAEQLDLCADLAAPADISSCVRGIKVANLLGSRTEVFVRLVDGCGELMAASRDACYRWLSRAAAVVTDGRFGRSGCPRLAVPEGRRACAAGVRQIDEALETFS